MYSLFFINILFISFNDVICEEFNLSGEAGQAYSLQVNIGHPPQKLNVLVDTGSTTLSIASVPSSDSNIYFHPELSNSLYDSGKKVHAKYSQGTWEGRLTSDYVQFPSIPSIPELRCDLALITKSHQFFMIGSGWQGLLGLAYLPVGASGDDIVVGSWLDSVDRALKKPASFELKLCGVQGITNSTHYGNFLVYDEVTITKNITPIFRTPILRERWYEVGVLSIRIANSSIIRNQGMAGDSKIDKDMCRVLNSQKSIVDSGTTNIRLPDSLFRQLVDELRNAALDSTVILDDFWYRGEAACWPEPQQWSLPSLDIDLISAVSDKQYFTLEISPQNYMRVMTAEKSDNGTISQYCYKLGLEAGGKETVLGYTAMEGFEVLFNRSAGWIGWIASSCGPTVRITGPYETTESLISICELNKPVEVAISIRAAQWTLCVISIIAAGVLIYLLAPCIKIMLVKRLTPSPQISLSQAALVQQESA